MSRMTPEEIRGINERAMSYARGPHIHRPARVRNEDGDVVGAFCACGALFNRKMRFAQSASRRQKIKAEMERIRDEAEEQAEEQEDE